MTEVHRRNPIKYQYVQAVKEGSACSLSTQGSSSPRYFETRGHRCNKEKLELCKKFTEHGYCPYEKKCKFAHGFHQLRKNNATNSKYKTKECVTFVQNCFCHYGSRCNFRHSAQEPELPICNKECVQDYRQIFQYAKSSSRVMALLRN